MTLGSEWKFSQVFGEQTPGDDIQDCDILSAMEFDKNGDHLAVGDQGGRVIIFERQTGKEGLFDSSSRRDSGQFSLPLWQHPEFKYKTEFQSHEPEFDYLKSVEIEEKINKIRWCTKLNRSLFLLTANDRTIKLWKIKEQKVKKVKQMDINPFVTSENSLLADKSFMSGQSEPSHANGTRLEWTDKMNGTLPSHLADITNVASRRCRRVYAHAHDFNINSISNNSDGETFLSGDDLRINVWNLEVRDQCFNIIDMKPNNMEDLTEVITSAEFHPFHCNLLAYSSSRGFIRLVDMRKSALCDHSVKILQDGGSRGPKTLFSEIITSISDMKYAMDGRHILSRDYMTLKLWDTHMDTSPVATYKIHEHLRPKLSKLYTNDAIFDKFDCCLNGDGLQFATGSYSNHLRIFSCGAENEDGITLEVRKSPNRKPTSQATTRPRRSSLSNLTRGFYRQGQDSSENEISCNLKSKLLHLAWHPTHNLIACSVGSSLFMYHA
ncbi:serine/threonine protein phosphatase 2A 55 kDa regulatory subunit B beta isoform isoform X1 [Nicotiana tabacum]|uniref:Serine/threonine-protein phosphatase 2A 55 kDa regulatory subunit B n=1 Tax=Nicotiana tabacum TaxID=4097 RepID=A0A1S4D9U7_TOBAC|nr:PREDICTED: serine/threonine protein phosphatase 2A 55 kDa regulatory subunit B beta isoform-like isoform X1 [Nicotiana tabacum]